MISPPVFLFFFFLFTTSLSQASLLRRSLTTVSIGRWPEAFMLRLTALPPWSLGMLMSMRTRSQVASTPISTFKRTVWGWGTSLRRWRKPTQKPTSCSVTSSKWAITPVFWEITFSLFTYSNLFLVFCDGLCWLELWYIGIHSTVKLSHLWQTTPINLDWLIRDGLEITAKKWQILTPIEHCEYIVFISSEHFIMNMHCILQLKYRTFIIFYFKLEFAVLYPSLSWFCIEFFNRNTMEKMNASRTNDTEKCAVTFTLFCDCQTRNQVSSFLMKCHNT